jgi:Tachylectin
MDMTWRGRKRIAFIPVHRTEAHPPDAPVPDDWPAEIMRRVYYDPGAVTGLADRSLRTYIYTVSSGMADLDATVLPMQLTDLQDVEPDAFQAQFGHALKAQGFDAAALVELGTPPTGRAQLDGFWSRFAMSEEVGTWAMELMHCLANITDLYLFGGNIEEYDNMGGGAGTHPTAWTKRAAQWLDPAAIAQHQGRSAAYDLHAVSLVQPAPHDRFTAVQIGADIPYLMVEARLKTDQFDALIPKEGVIVYRVQITGPGEDENQLPPLILLTLDPTGYRSALGVGESLTTDEGVLVQLVGAIPGGFQVRIDDPRQDPVVGQLLSYADAGTPGNVASPQVVGYGGWQEFTRVFSGLDVSGEGRIYAVDTQGELLSYGDSGMLANVTDPVVVGAGGWQDFSQVFGGSNLNGEHRIYAVDSNGRLLSYADLGSPANVSNPVVIGLGGWQEYRFVFSGRNAAGEARIYAVNSAGQLLSYGDTGAFANVSNPVMVGFGGWADFRFIFGGRNAAGEDHIYAVDASGELLAYTDSGAPGNVANPVAVGFGGWLGFKFLFAGENLAGEWRVYAVVA